MEIRKASRKKTKIKMGISGPSGCGKTYSSLLIAAGLCGSFEHVCIIDTERSADLYEQLGEYNVLHVEPPFTVDLFERAIKACEKAGMQVIIIDSISHFWMGEGGLLEENDTLTRTKYKGNSYMAWNETTPKYRKIVDLIRRADAHVICNLRSKSDYALEKMDSGKVSVKKMGLKEEMRDGFEYELSILFNIDQMHIATTSKDRTQLFDLQYFEPSIDTGKRIKDWCENGAEVRVMPEDLERMEKYLEQIKDIKPDIYAKTIGTYKTFDLERINKFVQWAETVLPTIE